MMVDPRPRAELEEERDFLLRSLTDLEREREAGDLDEADYQALRDDYTVRAAAALRALGAPPAAAPAAGPAPRPAAPAVPSPPRRQGRPVVVTVAVLVLAVGAGALVARSSGERLPGEPTTGSIEATGPSGELLRARQLIGEGKTIEAIRLYDTILESDATNPEALTYRGWLLLLAGRAAENSGLVDKGRAAIDQAIAADPTYPDAHFFKGLVLFQGRTDPAAAAAEFRAFLANDPPPDYVIVAEDALRRALADAEATTSSPTSAPPG